jgi:outer membrane protein assembly factor BamB
MRTMLVALVALLAISTAGLTLGAVYVMSRGGSPKPMLRVSEAPIVQPTPLGAWALPEDMVEFGKPFATALAVGDGLTFLADEQCTIHALSGTELSEKWTQNSGCVAPWFLEYDSRLLLATDAQSVNAINPETGALIWRWSTASLIASTQYDAGTVLVIPVASAPYELIALNSADGSGRWKRTFDTPVVVGMNQGILFVASESQVMQLDPASGETIQTFMATDPFIPVRVFASEHGPIVLSDQYVAIAWSNRSVQPVWVHDMGGTEFAGIDSIGGVCGSFAFFLVEDEPNAGQVRVLGLSDGTEVWRTEFHQLNHPPACDGNSIYLADNWDGAAVSRFELATGTRVWTLATTDRYGMIRGTALSDDVLTVLVGSHAESIHVGR